MTAIAESEARTKAGCIASDYIGTYAGERGAPTEFDTFDRLTYTVEKDDEGREVRCPAPVDEADIISSEVATDRHAPCIDLDVPVRYVESTTPGHGHLYIDVEMSWEQYDAILQALVAGGVVEEGYYRASLLRKGTHLRLPWVRKPQVVDLPAPIEGAPF